MSRNKKKRTGVSPRRWRAAFLSSLIVALLAIVLILPGASSTTAAGNTSEGTLPKHAPGQIIVKFKPSASPVVAKELQKGKDLAVKGSDVPIPSIRTLNAKHNVSSIEPVFKGLYRRMKEGKTASAAVDEVKARFPERAKRAPKGAGVPDLTGICLVKFPEGTDINEVLADFRKDPNIEYAEPNCIASAQWVPNDPYYSSSNSWGQGYDDMWGLKIIDMEHAWDRSKGAGVLVAVVDSGIDYNHPDLSTNVWKNLDEIPGNGHDDDHNGYVDDYYGIDTYYDDTDPMDGYGHGTHVAGTIAALTNNGIGVASVAPQAKVMAVKGISNTGRCYDTDLAKCIVYAADNGADVLNFSWCGEGDLPPITAACQYAHGLGCVLVAAAGNYNEDANRYCPANLPEVITVASSTHTDKKSDFSNWGPKIDVAAPGGDNSSRDSAPYRNRNILSLRAISTDFNHDGYSFMGIIGNDPPTYYYYRASGTSMAAPHVSGLAALVVSIRPDLTNEEIRQAIRIGSDDLGIDGRDDFFGDGRINAYYTLCNVSGTLALYSIKPNSGSVNKTVTITDLKGANFKSGATVWLESPAGVPLQKLPAANVVVVPPNKITCKFNLTGAKYSNYDVVVHNTDGKEAKLQSGFGVCGAGAGAAAVALVGMLGLMATTSSSRVRSRLKAMLKCY
jgi:subtilisin family serine protease